jgi:hypothetical protein
MATDVTLYQIEPAAQSHSSQVVGRYSLRGIESTGPSIDSMNCLSIDVEAHGPQQPLPTADKEGQKPLLTVSWLQLEVMISTWTAPRRSVGRVHLDERGMLPLRPGSALSGTWIWEIRDEDVELVDQARSNQPNAPLCFHVNISGIAKLIDDNNQIVDLVPVRSNRQQLWVELSHWDRLLQALGYTVPPSQASVVTRGALEHFAWADATKRLENARLHLRHGEDYDALRECLSAFEGLVSAPYNAQSWTSCLTSVQDQKADGLAELLSGFATYCNRIGHHRERQNRNDAGDFPVMPLDHWEADLAVAVAQYLLTYASRLRSNGLLSTTPLPATSEEGSP